MTISTSDLETENVDPDGPAGGEPTAVVSKSPLQLARERIRKDKLTMAALTITVIFVLVAIAAPILKAFGVLDPYTYHQELLNGFYPAGGSLGISSHHPIGIEPGTGRDLLSRVLLGITLSMIIAISAALVTVTVGTALGIISGFSGGLVDGIVGRIIDLVLAFPQTLMLLALSGVLVDRFATFLPGGVDGSLPNGAYVVIVLALFGWPPVARLMRGQVLSLRERDFVDAAILMGASRSRIYFKEILPNLWAPLLVYFTLLMPAYISAEAALSYLGVGIKPPTPTLGNVLSAALHFDSSDPIYFYVPAVLIALLVISFNLLGDGVRDALDPKSDR